MKAEELRIGNYVEDHSEDGGVVQVKEIGHLLDKKPVSIGFIIPSGGYSQTSLEENDGFDELEEDKMIQAIPLTEEWLLKFGFTVNANDIWFDKGDLSVLNDGTSVAFRNCDNYFNIGAKCKHVHQLQNLYFALTGEELTTTQQ